MEGQFPKSVHDAVQQSQDTMDLLNEFREPTVAVASGSRHFSLSPLALYTIYSVIYAAVIILFLYIRFKMKEK